MGTLLLDPDAQEILNADKRFHSINVPSEWEPLNFRSLPSKMSRDSFRRSGKKVLKSLTDSGKKAGNLCPTSDRSSQRKSNITAILPDLRKNYVISSDAELITQCYCVSVAWR